MAYAAVNSLKHAIKSLKPHMNPQIRKSAKKELNYIRYTLEKLDDESCRSIDRSVINELDAKIREAVWKLEDVLDKLHNSINISTSQGESCSWTPLVDEMEMEMEMFLKTVEMMGAEYSRVLENPSSREEEEDEAFSGAVPPVNNSTTVGLSDLSHTIRNQLLRREDAFLEFVSLVGMAGIGKTHLAADIYHDPLIVQHFHKRLWVNLGPKGRIMKNVLIDIVSQIEGKPRDLFKEKDMYSLKDLIETHLQNSQRYLIVLDDIWSKEVLEYFIMLFLTIANGSRVLLTTRQQDAIPFHCYYNRHTMNEMPFLDSEESWNLLWQNVFVAEKSFPPQLEKPGRKIANNSEGLPLLILTVANILRGLDKTREYWEKVAEKKTTTFTDAYDQIYEVLLPSYEYLPQHLKACFLYMGVFPQGCEIPISKLINLWVIEDFIEPDFYKKFERPAMDSMKGIVSKSLAIVCKWSFEKDRRIKSSKLHSVNWYMCVKEARKNRFFHVLIKLTDVYIERPRRLAVQNNILLGLNDVHDSIDAITSTTRSLLCTGEDHQYPVRICFNMMLMKVFDALAIRFYEFPEEVIKLLQLRYLSLTHNGELPSSVSKLQQLECLILRQHHNIKFSTAPKTYLPDEIWDMKELRHVRIMGSNLPDPSKGANLPKLSTLYVNADSCTQAVFRSIPNLKKLGITIELEPDAATETVRCFEHIKLLINLESLKCVVMNPRLRSQLAMAPPDHLSNLPESLKKLSLNGLGYSWKDMTAISSLVHLYVLKLRCCAFQGPHWETRYGEFRNLESLLLEDIDLVHWKAQGSEDYSCFPRLGHLIVRRCYKLKMIPEEIKCISTLGRMEVDDCGPSVVASAHQIKLKKRKKPRLQLVINSSWSL